MAEIDAVIMASGSSRRMGSNKLLLPFGDSSETTLLGYFLKGFPFSLFHQVILVCADPQVAAIAEKFPLTVCHNDAAQQGKSESIKKGVERSTAQDGILFLVADQPFLLGKTINTIISAFVQHPDAIIVPHVNGKPKNPVLFPTLFRDQLQQLEGDEGGRKVIGAYPELVQYLPFPFGDDFCDIDDPTTYQRMLNRLKKMNSDHMTNQPSNLVVVRGGGDVATGTISRLHNAGFAVLILETARPTAIRRAVSFCEAVYDGVKNVEGVVARKIETIEESSAVLSVGEIALLIDPKGDCLQKLKPLAVIDCILAKRNCGTTKDMAPITIGLGPGFCAGLDVDAVVETKRGHDLGRVLYEGMASANTGIPGEVNGYSKERVIYSQLAGRWQLKRDIGSHVSTGDTIGYIDSTPVIAPIPGIVRGVIRDQFIVTQGLKIADIDPRVEEEKNCSTISDKARCVSGGVLEAVMHLSASILKATQKNC